MIETYVTIEKYEFLPEADAIRMHLEGEGIPATLADKETVSTEWALGNAVGYIKLQVPAEFEAQARTILQELTTRRKTRKAGMEGATNRCLSCDAEMTADQTACPKCGWSYGEPDEVEQAVTAEREAATQPGVLEGLRSLKTLTIWTVLLPIIMGICGFLALVISELGRSLFR